MPGASANTSINSFCDSSGRIIFISSTLVVSTLREAATTMGEDILGFSPTEIGCHSICSVYAMALYLAGFGVATIMLIGRCRSYSFLCYIWKQVQQFSSGISSLMIKLLLLWTAQFSFRRGLLTRATIARDNNCKLPSVNLNISVWG